MGPNPAVPRWNALANVIDHYALVGHLIAAVTIIFEITCPLAFFWPRSRVVYAAVSTTLHVSTYFIFGLDYWAWIGTVWVLFVDWVVVYDRYRARSPGPPATVP